MKYVMANRRAGKFHETEKRASRESAERALSLMSTFSDSVGQHTPEDPLARLVAVFEAAPEEVTAKAAQLGPDVILEEERLRYPSVSVPLDLMTAATQAAFVPPATVTQTLRVTVRGNGVPLANAEVFLFIRGPGGRMGRRVARSEATGNASFSFPTQWMPTALLVDPWAQFWPVVVRGPYDGIVVDAPALPALDDNVWWRTLLGANAPNAGAGAGVTVGVIDTGCGPHLHLDHVRGIGAFLGGNVDRTPAAAADIAKHGTHVCGIIGARRTGPGVRGIAAEADLLVARVFPAPMWPDEPAANQGDTANAIDTLSRELSADLINMSLGGAESQIEHDAIQDAAERGTLCVCAAGNSAGPIEYPGAFPESVAVSALGLLGWAPPGTLSATRYPTDSDRYGDQRLFLANFSCFGQETDTAAPGVGIVSTVPVRDGVPAFAAMDGTSMASPAACGTLAAVLSSSQDYLALSRSLDRSEYARRLLRQACRYVGLPEHYEGRGVPFAASL